MGQDNRLVLTVTEAAAALGISRAPTSSSPGGSEIGDIPPAEHDLDWYLQNPTSATAENH